MANAIKVERSVKIEDRSPYASHTGDIYISEIFSEDGALRRQEIWASSPTLSNFDAAPVGTLMHDLDDETKLHKHNTATTWVTLTFA